MRQRPARLEPGPPRTVALLSLLLLALLGLVALASRGERPLAGGGGASEPSHAFWDYLFSVWLALGALGLALGVWAAATRGGGRDLAEQRKRTRLLGTVFLIAVLVGLALAARSGDGFPGLRGDDRIPATDSRPAPADGDGEAAEPYTPEFRPLPLLVLAAAAAAAAVAVAVRRRRRPIRAAAGEHELAEELAALLDDTLDDLRAEPDARRAVIAAYARMERVLERARFPRRPFEAPLEYLDRIASPLHEVLPSAGRLVFELTHLFERAKFSPHPVDAEMKADAIATLASLRDELRAVEAAA